MLWKHVDAETGAEVRRMRRMVVSAHATVANYEYLVYWRFYQDGNIECEVRATGIMVTTPLESDDDSSPYGTMVDTAHLRAVPPALPGRQARPRHRRRGEHRGGGRLGRRADRRRTTRTGWRCTTQDTDRSSPRASRPATSTGRPSGPGRSSTPTSGTATARNTAYKLVPGAAIPALMDPSSPRYQRAPVIGHTLWVTAHDDDERWPAGDYPTQSMRGHRHHPVDHRRRIPGGHRRRALVRLRHPPHHPDRGLADHASRHHLVLAQAVRILRPEPRSRCPEHDVQHGWPQPSRTCGAMMDRAPAVLRRSEPTCFSSASDDEVGGDKARSARSERSEWSNQTEFSKQ